MTILFVKPNPTLDPAVWPLLKHPHSGGLLDGSGKVPADGRPWLDDGFTARMILDRAVLPASDPVFASKPAPTEPEKAPQASEPDALAH